MNAGKLRRWLTGVGGVLLMLTAGAHAIGSSQAAPDEPGRQLEAQMRAYRIPFGTDNDPTMMDAFNSISHTMTITFVAFGLLSILIAWSGKLSDGLLRGAALINTLWCAAFAALSWHYHLPPPAICGAVCAAAFLAAAFAPGPKVT